MPHSMSSVAGNWRDVGKDWATKLRGEVGADRGADDAGGVGSSRPIACVTSFPRPALSASPSCATPQWPSRMNSVSTTAIGQERNVLVKTAMATTRIAISHSTSNPLMRFQLNHCVLRTRLRLWVSTLYHVPSLRPVR